MQFALRDVVSNMPEAPIPERKVVLLTRRN